MLLENTSLLDGKLMTYHSLGKFMVGIIRKKLL